jgi:hypothetical protein
MTQGVLKDILLLEYEKLKDEQRARITIRENLFYIALVIVGATFSALLTLTGVDIGYLAITPVMLVISNSYYYNDEIVSRMNVYVRESLGPRIAAATGLKKEDLFQWEGFTRRTHRVRRRSYQFVANLILYPGASAAALAFFVSRKSVLTPIEQLAVVTCGLITALMLVRVIAYADIFSGRHD